MKMTPLSSIFTILLIIFSKTITSTASEVHFLEQGEKFSRPANRYTKQFDIFCYKGRPKYLINLWQSVVLQLSHPNDEYEQYDGNNPESVQNEFEARRYSWSFNIFSIKQKQIRIDPFNQSCIGIESNREYSIQLNVIRIDYWKVIFLLFGISLFISAEKLCKNTLFYYICGITFGICLSFLILIYFLSKLFPRKPLMYGVAACGWTVGIYILQLLWDNIRVILLNYKIYLLYYALITGFISFIVCYRWGPVENERSRNLIRWSLQGFALAAIFCSTHFQEAAMGQIVILLFFHNVPPSWLSKPQKYWKRKFPPKVKVLTNDEYYEQGVRETNRALEELREFCTSPECKQWEMALKLKDVKRFASFIEGNSHLSDSEVLEYETSIQTTDLTDDDDSSDALTEEED